MPSNTLGTRYFSLTLLWSSGWRTFVGKHKTVQENMSCRKTRIYRKTHAWSRAQETPLVVRVVFYRRKHIRRRCNFEQKAHYCRQLSCSKPSLLWLSINTRMILGFLQKFNAIPLMDNNFSLNLNRMSKQAKIQTMSLIQ